MPDILETEFTNIDDELEIGREGKHKGNTYKMH